MLLSILRYAWSIHKSGLHQVAQPFFSSRNLRAEATKTRFYIEQIILQANDNITDLTQHTFITSILTCGQLDALKDLAERLIASPVRSSEDDGWWPDSDDIGIFQMPGHNFTIFAATREVLYLLNRPLKNLIDAQPVPRTYPATWHVKGPTGYEVAPLF